MIRKLMMFVASLGLVVTIAAPVTVSAATNLFGDTCKTTAAKDSAVCQKTQTTNPLTGSNGLLIKITRIIAFVAGIVAVIIIMISGLEYVNSGGDATKAAKARNGIIYALVGLVVIISAQFIISLVISRIG